MIHEYSIPWILLNILWWLSVGELTLICQILLVKWTEKLWLSFSLTCDGLWTLWILLLTFSRWLLLWLFDMLNLIPNRIHKTDESECLPSSSCSNFTSSRHFTVLTCCCFLVSQLLVFTLPLSILLSFLFPVFKNSLHIHGFQVELWHTHLKVKCLPLHFPPHLEAWHVGWKHLIRLLPQCSNQK